MAEKAAIDRGELMRPIAKAEDDPERFASFNRLCVDNSNVTGSSK